MARDERYADIMSAAESLLFVSDEPVSAARLSEILEVSPVEMDEALVLLSAEYMDENRGIQLREVAGGWRFYTHPAYHDIIERYVISWDTHRMSQAALEALAVIAYHQPVTRATVNAIRGVNSESVVSSLVEKGLVREMGRDKPGGSILYGTTRTFLERFGLKSVKDLPPLEDFAPDEDSREQIRERLSSAGKAPDMQLELTEEISEDSSDEGDESIREEAAITPAEEYEEYEDDDDFEPVMIGPDGEEVHLDFSEYSQPSSPKDEEQDSDDGSDDEPFQAVSSMRNVVTIIDEVEEVDTGDDERFDEPEEMAEVISVAMTEKVELSYDDDDDDIQMIE